MKIARYQERFCEGDYAGGAKERYKGAKVQRCKGAGAQQVHRCRGAEVLQQMCRGAKVQGHNRCTGAEEVKRCVLDMECRCRAGGAKVQ